MRIKKKCLLEFGGFNLTYLFNDYQIKNLNLKNRIVMSPMCMYSSDDSGKLTEWHKVHYASRAVGGVGLIMQEATAIEKQGRISERDLGIWGDEHIEGYKELTSLIHSLGSKIGIQLAHAGRKADISGTIYSASPIRYDENYKIPKKLTLEEIAKIINNFRLSAKLATKCGYDVIEIHAAHGYLINAFLSPLSNKRTDNYGKDREGRFKLLKQIIRAVKEEWDGPLFVRISANEYLDRGNTMADFLFFSKKMKQLGVDLIDCSSGAVAPAKIEVYPGYQVKYSEEIKRQTSISTGAVGLITKAKHAEEIIANNKADLVFLGRELLRDPYWVMKACHELGSPVIPPKQYERAYRSGRTLN